MKPTYSIDTPDQARLKVARTEIEAILRKHDLAGVVVLHTPGMTEFFYDVQPSYSCACIDEEHHAVRIKSVGADYGGDRQAQRHDLSATSNLFFAVASDLNDAAGMFAEIAGAVDLLTNAKHTAAVHVPDPTEEKRH